MGSYDILPDDKDNFDETGFAMRLVSTAKVGCFVVLKRSYSSLVDQQIRCGMNHIEKLHVLAAYSHPHTDTLKTNTIQNAL